MDRWDIQEVGKWLRDIGFAAFEKKFKENDISGDVLIHADHDMLKELGISSVGQRIALLKAVFHLKVQYGIPFEEGDYIPETVSYDKDDSPVELKRSPHPDMDMDDSSRLERLERKIREQDQIIHRLSKEFINLDNDLASLRVDLAPVWNIIKEYKSLQQQKSDKKSKSNAEKNSLNLMTSSSSSSSKVKSIVPSKIPALNKPSTLPQTSLKSPVKSKKSDEPSVLTNLVTPISAVSIYVFFYLFLILLLHQNFLSDYFFSTFFYLFC